MDELRIYNHLVNYFGLLRTINRKNNYLCTHIVEYVVEDYTMVVE